MSISVQDLISTAESLLSQTSAGEPEYRASINRSYYAAFHDCKIWHDALPAMGALPAIQGGMHADLIGRLQQPMVTDIALARKSRSRAYALKSMKEIRTNADYKLSSSVMVHEAVQCIVDAKRIIAT